MNVESKSYTLHIFGMDYKIVSDEPEAHLIQAAATVDRLMKEIAGGSTHAEKHKVAVLAALQVASTLLYNQQEIATKKNHENAVMNRLERILASLS